jgi:putative lipoprotein
MLNRALITLISVPLFAALVSAQANNAQLTGTIVYHERFALPSDAVIDVQLLDTSVADIAAQTVAEVIINAEGRQVPVPFTLAYDPAQIVPAHHYSVRATIRSGDGMLMFSTTQAYPVLTYGAPSKISLLLHTVGHGAKPVSTAKKQAPPAASQGTASTPQSAPPTASESAATAPPSPSEPAATAATAKAQEQEKSADQAEARPTQGESKALAPSSISPESQSSQSTLAPTENAATTTPVTGSATPAQIEQQAAPAEPSAAASPEAQITQPESKPEEVLPTPEHVTPTDSAAAPGNPASETKTAEPEAPLPEAPSATKRAELEAAAPATGEEAEGESTSRPERPLPNKALTPLADTQWKLIQLGGQDVVITPPQKPMTLAFSPEGRRIAGSAGCNSYLGTFTDDHGHLELQPGNMTLMVCPEPAGSREKKFVSMLRSADGYKINGDFLVLTSNGKTVAKFKNNPPL